METRRGRLLPAVTAVLALVVAGMVTGVIPARATHQFPDVTSGSPFHAAIDNFVNAGCATGFPDGTYRPTDPVLRQQMARFVNACGGRVAFDASPAAIPLTATFQTIAQAEVTAGALTGGGFVSVAASARVFASSTTPGDYPCELLFGLSQTGGVTDISGRGIVLDLNGPIDGAADETGSMHELVAVEAGHTVTVTLRAKTNPPTCAAQVGGLGDLLLQYYPFDGNGDGGGESIP
jgi:S-layer homology domain